VESPSHLRGHGDELTVTLLAAWEITDALVTLLLRTVHAIEARADRRVTKQLVAEFKRAQGKENLLFRVAEAATARPDDTVRQVVFPIVGEDNVRHLVAEYKASGSAYRRTVQTTYRAWYSHHYRKGLIRLLDVLEFRCDNSHRPVLDALALVHRYRTETDLTYYPAGETVPTHPGLSGDWAEPAHRVDGRGRRRTVRTVYEIRAFEARRTRRAQRRDAAVLAGDPAAAGQPPGRPRSPVTWPHSPRFRPLASGNPALAILRESRSTPHPYAWAQPPLSWHALVPFTFRIQVSHQTQEPPSEFLPAALGIHQGASRRTTHAGGRARSTGTAERSPRCPGPDRGSPTTDIRFPDPVRYTSRFASLRRKV
jgi:hypothetical protein